MPTVERWERRPNAGESRLLRPHVPCCVCHQDLNDVSEYTVRVVRGQVAGSETTWGPGFTYYHSACVRDLGIALPKLVHCPCCEHYHPQDWDGDCRDDANRYPWPEDPDDEADNFDVNPFPTDDDDDDADSEV